MANHKYTPLGQPTRRSSRFARLTWFSVILVILVFAFYCSDTIQNKAADALEKSEALIEAKLASIKTGTIKADDSAVSNEVAPALSNDKTDSFTGLNDPSGTTQDAAEESVAEEPVAEEPVVEDEITATAPVEMAESENTVTDESNAIVDDESTITEADNTINDNAQTESLTEALVEGENTNNDDAQTEPITDALAGATGEEATDDNAKEVNVDNDAAIEVAPITTPAAASEKADKFVYTINDEEDEDTVPVEESSTATPADTILTTEEDSGTASPTLVEEPEPVIESSEAVVSQKSKPHHGKPHGTRPKGARPSGTRQHASKPHFASSVAAVTETEDTTIINEAAPVAESNDMAAEPVTGEVVSTAVVAEDQTVDDGLVPDLASDASDVSKGSIGFSSDFVSGDQPYSKKSLMTHLPVGI